MKKSLLIFTLLITAGSNLQAMDDGASSAATSTGADQQQEQAQEICNHPNCEEKASSKKCAKCSIFYCDQECQRADWKGHASYCRMIIKGTKGTQVNHKRPPTPQEEKKFLMRVHLTILAEQQNGDLKEARYLAAIAGQLSKSSAELTGFTAKIANADKQHRLCAKCGESNTKLKCSRCLGASYCNKDCQKAHWPTHKAICQAPQQQ